MICNLYSMSITKKNVSKACKISEVTIKCFKKMNKYKKHLVDNIPKKKKRNLKKVLKIKIKR